MCISSKFSLISYFDTSVWYLYYQSFLYPIFNRVHGNDSSFISHTQFLTHRKNIIRWCLRLVTFYVTLFKVGTIRHQIKRHSIILRRLRSMSTRCAYKNGTCHLVIFHHAYVNCCRKSLASNHDYPLWKFNPFSHVHLYTFQRPILLQIWIDILSNLK